jgi:hypothetical protein
MRMIELRTLAEIRAFVRSRQMPDGGFADRGGRSDLYYSLFGYFIAEALFMDDILPELKAYVKKEALSGKLDGIHQKCAVILWAKLFGAASIPDTLRKPSPVYATYSEFINLLAGYYSKDYQTLYRIQQKFTAMDPMIPMPCAVTAAQLVLFNCIGKSTRALEIRMNQFYRPAGSFSPLLRAPAGELLSTGVALYALRFVRADMRKIAPSCIDYVDSLYDNGAFRDSQEHDVLDVEYTFYGLLALGALSEG